MIDNKKKKNVDTTKTITHIGLCAGYGGIEIGLHRVIRNLRTVALCEVEAFCCANLVAKMEAGLMDAAPIWTNLKSFPWAEFRDRVDILTGGYPCQPFSAAGKRLGTDDPRHLWPFIADGIRILRPKLCFFENVEGHISLGLREVIGELESIGYKSSWGIFSAAEVGAPHQRKRVFILAVSNSLGGAAGLSRSLAWNERFAGVSDNGGGEGCGELADAPSAGHSANAGGICRSEGEAQRQNVSQLEHCSTTPWPSRPGQPQHGWEPPRVVGNARVQEPCRLSSGSDRSDVATAWESSGRQAQPALGRDADGTAGGLGYAELQVSCDNRTDELRLLGNGVVPATAERAFRILMEEIISA
jgi:DNA (cytosine-5)-methyltransferase 1